MSRHVPLTARILRCTVILVLAAAIPGAAASNPADLRASNVEGVVLDAAGQPVAGVSVSFQWRFDDKGATALFDEAVTGDDGKFAVNVVFPLGNRPVALLALDRERRRGALVQAYSGKSVRMSLEPLRQVTASFVGSESGAKVPAEMAIYSGDAKPRFAWVLVPQGEMKIALPAGEMWYGVKSDGRIEVRALLNLERGETPYAIGSIPLDPVAASLSGN